jgi:uncharacterized membrane protein YgcG
MAHALIFDGADMKPDVRALFTNAAVSYELGPLIAAVEHAGDSTKCDGLNVEHLVDMNFGEFAKSPLTYAKLLIGVRNGVAPVIAVAAVAEVRNAAGGVVTAAVVAQAAVAGIPGLGGLAGLAGSEDDCAEEILHPLMRLHRAARNELARLAPGGNLTPQTIADAIGGSAAADKLTARARTLNEAEVAGILAAGYATGRAKPDFPWDRAGGRLMSVMAFHSSVLPDAGVRKPRPPSYKDAPFDAVLTEENVLAHNPAKPTSASLIGAKAVWLLAWDLCAAQVSKPVLFLGSGARLSSDPALFRAVILALHRLKDIDPMLLLEQLKLLQDQMHQWSEAASCDIWYPKVVDRLESIRYVLASRIGAVAAGAVAGVTSAALVETLNEDGTPVKGRGKRPSKEGTPESRQLAHVQRENEAMRAKLAKNGLGKNGKGGRGGKGGGGWYDGWSGRGGGWSNDWSNGWSNGKGSGGGGPPPPPPGTLVVRDKCNDFIQGRCTRGAACRFTH